MIREICNSHYFRLALVPVLAIGALLIPLAACNGGDDGFSSTSGTGHLSVELTDMPIDIDTVQSVNVTIDSVTVYGTDPDASQLEVMSGAATFDLLTLTGGVTTLLAADDLPVGFYHKIRLGIPDADMVFMDGTMVDLKIESKKVDINVPFEIVQDAEMVVTLDFEADASVHIVGTGSDMYILRPVVRAIRVSDPDPIPLPDPGDPNADPNGDPGDPNGDPGDPNGDPGDPNSDPGDPNAP